MMLQRQENRLRNRICQVCVCVGYIGKDITSYRSIVTELTSHSSRKCEIQMYEIKLLLTTRNPAHLSHITSKSTKGGVP